MMRNELFVTQLSIYILEHFKYSTMS